MIAPTRPPSIQTQDSRLSTERASVRARIPLATYRLQFNRNFTFLDACRWIPYLRQLGVSDMYASPYLQASAESTHGYDVANHNALNPAIGDEADYEQMTAELRRYGMGQLLDIVPNHMGIAETANTWWMDVLENGPSSPYAGFFDISWESLKEELRDKVLLPILGDQYGVVLENGELKLTFKDGAFFLTYYENTLPIAPRTYRHIVQPLLGALAAELEVYDERLLELQGIITAITHLPVRSETAPERITERQRGTEEIKRRLAALVEGSPQVREALEATLRMLNGVKGKPTSFDLLDGLLNDQAYRLAFWRVASEEINYRRFFDINQLAAIRVEHPAVFQETHRLILRLLSEGKLTGVRIDHPDGLWDPAGYLRQLQTSYLEALAAGSSNVGRQVAQADGETGADRPRPPSRGVVEQATLPLYVVVEKILSQGEELPRDWPTQGTTGYDFANEVGGILVDGGNRRAFDALYARFIDRRINYRDLVNSTKKMIMLVSLASEINAIAHRLNRLSERHRRFRDFTLNSLTFAIREIIAALPVYRTYNTCDGTLTEHDRKAIEAATAEAKRRNPRTETSIFNFIRDLLLLRYPTGSDATDRAEQCEFVMKFQQTTGPVMAKGVEDTAFYVYNRLVSLNEVGGEPDRFGISVAEFHRRNAVRQACWPYAMLATSTHDTKRSEDVRARISVLSEMPREFVAALGRWSRHNARHKREVEGEPAPDRNDEYLLYQTLLGAWPYGTLDQGQYQQFVERIVAYMEKATREAKVHTSWINPNEAYDQAISDFVRRVLDRRRSASFLNSLEPLQQKVAYYGVFNALTQTLLKLTSPGVPDIYQGNELWDLSLVDPDNRRPVDYELRSRLLRELRDEIARRGDDGGLASLAHDLLAAPEDGRVKLFLTHRALQLRQARPELFRDGSYEPLTVEGERADHVCAFARSYGGDRLIAAAPRLLSRLVSLNELPLGASVWGETWLRLPEQEAGQRFRNIFTREVLQVVELGSGVGLRLANVFGSFSHAALERLDG